MGLVLSELPKDFEAMWLYGGVGLVLSELPKYFKAMWLYGGVGKGWALLV